MVVKFGGSVLESAEDYLKASERVAELLRHGSKPVVVVSAMKGVTQLLLDAFYKKDPALLKEVREKHEEAARKLGGRGEEEVSKLLEELERVFWAFKVLPVENGEVRDLMLSFGERLSIHLMAEALRALGVEAAPLYGRAAGIVTNEKFGEAVPVEGACSLVRSAVSKCYDGGKVPVIAGFVGETVSGRITTMGRGGSDYTATFIGACLGAEEVRLVTDVPGVFTGDPKLFPSAKLLRALSYEEAMELSRLGGKKFHPRTFEPLLSSGVAARVTSMDCGEGTTIGPEESWPPLKAVAITGPLDLVVVKGSGMVGRLGTAAKLSSLFSEAGANIVALGQPASETSMNFLVEGESSERVAEKLRELAASGYVRSFEVLGGAYVASLVGHGLRSPRHLGRVLAALSEQGSGILMLVKGPRDVSLTAVVEKESSLDVAKALHEVVLEQWLEEGARSA